MTVTKFILTRGDIIYVSDGDYKNQPPIDDSGYYLLNGVKGSDFVEFRVKAEDVLSIMSLNKQYEAIDIKLQVNTLLPKGIADTMKGIIV